MNEPSIGSCSHESPYVSYRQEKSVHLAKARGPNQGSSTLRAGTKTPAAPSPIIPRPIEAQTRLGEIAKRTAPPNPIKVNRVTTLLAPHRSVKMPTMAERGHRDKNRPKT